MLIGIDLGGTNIAGGLVAESGQLMHTFSVPTEAEKGYSHVLEGISKVIKHLEGVAKETNERVVGVGIGVPGLADDHSGIVYECVNLYWKDPVDLRSDLKALTGFEVHIGNDASVAAVAEYAIGALRGVRNGILVTLGTGVGGGVIVNGHAFSGSYGVGSEIGHMVVAPGFYRCNCGRMGCLETYASATGLIKAAQKALDDGGHSEYLTGLGIETNQLEAKHVIDGAKTADPLLLSVFNEMIKYLAIGIINLVMIIDPEVIALGGGVSKAGSFLLDALESAIESERNFKIAPKFSLKIAEAGNEAGVIGAAMLCQ